MPRPPAYAKAVIRERDLGNHPERIWVIFGNDWGRRPAVSVCVRPGDYTPGAFDWRWCGGVSVNVVERDKVDAEDRDSVQLSIEIAKFTAPVFICWEDDFGTHKVDIADFMDSNRDRNRKRWNKTAVAKYLLRRETYYASICSALLARDQLR